MKSETLFDSSIHPVLIIDAKVFPNMCMSIVLRKCHKMSSDLHVLGHMLVNFFI